MHDLNGLPAGSPIAFLAALGMLRVLVSDRGLDLRLGWRNGHAVIDGIDPNTAIEELAANMTERAKSPEFKWADTLKKCTPEAYRKACNQMAGDHRALGFMAGWATDAVLNNGFIRASRMDMTTARQRLLKDLRVLARKVTQADFRSALLGGSYGGQSSFGFDPVAFRSHANEPQAPTKSKTPGKPGLIWLVFESIPLHPVVSVLPNQATTIGWRIRPNISYVWAIWSVLLTLEEVTLLRALPVDNLAGRPGVVEVWASRLGQTGRYPWLLPARRER